MSLKKYKKGKKKNLTYHDSNTRPMTEQTIAQHQGRNSSFYILLGLRRSI